MPLRYLIVEDELPARSRLKRLLAELSPGSECIGEAWDGMGGLALLTGGEGKADALFLDIEFPPEGAFGMLRCAREARLSLPPIVFTTAYDTYAVEAFRWAAWDYLLKPVEPGQLQEALQRLGERGEIRPGLPELMQAFDSTRQARLPERFTVRVKKGLKVLAWADVVHLCTENGLVFVHTQEGRFMLDRTLQELEDLLKPGFFRCHRKALIAIRHLREIRPGEDGPGEVVMANGSVLPVSRDRLPELRRLVQ